MKRSDSEISKSTELISSVQRKSGKGQCWRYSHPNAITARTVFLQSVCVKGIASRLFTHGAVTQNG